MDTFLSLSHCVSLSVFVFIFLFLCHSLQLGVKTDIVVVFTSLPMTLAHTQVTKALVLN